MEELQASKGNPIDCATAKKIDLKSSPLLSAEKYNQTSSTLAPKQTP
jgi:hypothetical protein